jgi:hypothetical protein
LANSVCQAMMEKCVWIIHWQTKQVLVKCFGQFWGNSWKQIRNFEMFWGTIFDNHFDLWAQFWTQHKIFSISHLNFANNWQNAVVIKCVNCSQSSNDLLRIFCVVFKIEPINRNDYQKLYPKTFQNSEFVFMSFPKIAQNILPTLASFANEWFIRIFPS